MIQMEVVFHIGDKIELTYDPGVYGVLSRVGLEVSEIKVDGKFHYISNKYIRRVK